MAIEERTEQLNDYCGTVMLLRAHEKNPQTSIPRMFIQAECGHLYVDGTWGQLHVSSKTSPETGDRTFTVKGPMAHCPDCGDEYSGPLACNCFGQRRVFRPR